jgi:hypothetical protein
MRLPLRSLKFWCMVDSAAVVLLVAAIIGARPAPAFCAQQFVPLQPLAPGFASLTAKPSHGGQAPACIRLLFEE